MRQGSINHFTGTKVRSSIISGDPIVLKYSRSLEGHEFMSLNCISFRHGQELCLTKKEQYYKLKSIIGWNLH